MSICQNCGGEFEQSNKYRESKTCSKECRYALSGRSNKQIQGAQYLDRECPVCGKSFDGKTTHCSRTCSNKARAGERHPNKLKGAFTTERPCKVCGEPTQHSQRDTCPQHRRGWQQRELPMCPCGQPAVNFRSKYCSEEHRKKWGKKLPVVMITKICLGCGNEFQRPIHYPGKLKYCSNKCAHKEQKATTEVAALCENERTLIFRSTWEMRFYCACVRFDIPIRSYDGPDIQTSLGTYRPDFIITLPTGEQIVDVKGWYRPKSFIKITEANEQGYDVRLIPKPTLLTLETGEAEQALALLGAQGFGRVTL